MLNTLTIICERYRRFIKLNYTNYEKKKICKSTVEPAHSLSLQNILYTSRQIFMNLLEVKPAQDGHHSQLRAYKPFNYYYSVNLSAY